MKNILQLINTNFLDISIIILVILISLYIHNNLKHKRGTWNKFYYHLDNKKYLDYRTVCSGTSSSLSGTLFPGNVVARDKSNYHKPRHLSRSKTTKYTTNSKGEIQCKYALENIFKKPFKKVRPNFMFNDITGSNLELDLYNPELKLSVEYSGRQHYQYVPFFHRNGKQDFYNQKYRDKIKKELCHKNGITLIVVPYTVKLHNIEKFIIKELYKHGYT